MVKKKITILAIDEGVSIFFKNELEKIFGEMFTIEYRNPEMEPVPLIYDTDLILYTDPEILNRFIEIIKCDSPTLMMKRTITREALKKIKQIPARKKALVANINQYMANETMALLYQLGITDVQFFPYYEGKKDYPEDIDYIIVPEDKPYDFLPGIEAEIILTGNRVFDISNVLDILSILRVNSKKSREIIRGYLLKVPTFWYGFEYGWENRRVLLEQWKLLLDELDDGVIISDAENKIDLINYKARKYLNLKEEKLIGQGLEYLVENNEELNFLLAAEEKKDEPVKFASKDLVITVKVVKFNNSFYGKIILLKPYTKMVKVQQKIHKKLVGKGYYSKHTFSDLLGDDPGFKETKEIARKVARSNSTVLLQGASGTGKELFAGAIHNYSQRQNEPFVAINCSTLPENLLESELFGYEDGAFTGAKKGGKIGLFERADRGTLFLDEIGDLPLKLQARLLRVLEEKEIMRVGGDSIISIDVRIIAATNRDLLKSVEKREFRKDLFYRLNVFQINIPRLASRVQDIPVLISHFLQEMNEERKVCRDFMIFAKNYSWPGNVRELKNILEYMVTISEKDLSFINLPDYLHKKNYYVDRNYNGKYLLLKLLLNREKEGKPTGRRSLTGFFKNKIYDISEMEVRELIKELEKRGLLEIKRGPTGNRITNRGREKLKKEGFIRLKKGKR